MITADQLRAARALLGLDQRHLSELSGLSVPTIQRMEASNGVTKLITALETAGITFIAENAPSLQGGCGIRLARPKVVYPEFPDSKPLFTPMDAA